MRRSLAGLLLLTSCVLFAASAGMWWLQHVAFSPSADTDVTYAILGDEDIRGEIATLIATADAEPLGQSRLELKEYIEQSTRLYDGAALMNTFVSSAHARLIGDTDDEVVVTAAEQVQVVRNELVALEPAITLPVKQVGTLSLVNTVSAWGMLLTAALGLITLIAGALTRPERGEFTFALAAGLGVFAVLNVVLGYLLPLGPLSALSDNTWMGVLPRLANNSRNTTLLVSLVSGVAAGALLVGTSSLRQRRQKSTPLSVGRYNQQHSWSR